MLLHCRVHDARTLSPTRITEWKLALERFTSHHTMYKGLPQERGMFKTNLVCFETKGIRRRLLAAKKVEKGR